MKISKAKLKSILDSHAAWLRGEPGGKRADMSRVDLRGANMNRAPEQNRV